MKLTSQMRSVTVAVYKSGDLNRIEISFVKKLATELKCKAAMR